MLLKQTWHFLLCGCYSKLHHFHSFRTGCSTIFRFSLSLLCGRVDFTHNSQGLSILQFAVWAIFKNCSFFCSCLTAVFTLLFLPKPIFSREEAKMYKYIFLLTFSIYLSFHGNDGQVKILKIEAVPFHNTLCENSRVIYSKYGRQRSISTIGSNRS